MKREILLTADGSHTIHLPEFQESYHSKHGSINESLFVYINSGLKYIDKKEIQLLEMGFGSGLNALLTNQYAKQHHLHIQYTTLEAFPIAFEEALKLNYPEVLNESTLKDDFIKMHQQPWGQANQINDFFLLCKKQQLFQDFNEQNSFDLIYFDVFGYRVQPELWSEEIFKSMYEALKPQGVLVTYACTNLIKNKMQNAGFSIEKLRKPPGTREMLRAQKK